MEYNLTTVSFLFQCTSDHTGSFFRMFSGQDIKQLEAVFFSCDLYLVQEKQTHNWEPCGSEVVDHLFCMPESSEALNQCLVLPSPSEILAALLFDLLASS